MCFLRKNNTITTEMVVLEVFQKGRIMKL